MKRAKQCRVNIGKKHLKVEVAGTSGAWETVIDGDLCWEINREESMWTLVNDVPRPGQPKQSNIHVSNSFRKTSSSGTGNVDGTTQLVEVVVDDGNNNISSSSFS